MNNYKEEKDQKNTAIKSNQQRMKMSHATPHNYQNKTNEEPKRQNKTFHTFHDTPQLFLLMSIICLIMSTIKMEKTTKPMVLQANKNGLKGFE